MAATSADTVRQHAWHVREILLVQQFDKRLVRKQLTKCRDDDCKMSVNHVGLFYQQLLPLAFPHIELAELLRTVIISPCGRMLARILATAVLQALVDDAANDSELTCLEGSVCVRISKCKLELGIS
ncbi:hypothetical protein BZM27_46715 [Paraburkholderia steynii]|uniref:Uncharacterized protein n=1 Tax=Paraburkholderia steynii TaxID=1245441 RepID=A0A4R0X0Y3_9BURK|nr:hypothetical protein BZM27_46715 [Paraburkholderia steynii]